MENQVNNGYEEIDKLVSNQNRMLDNALEQQNNMVDRSTQMTVERLEKNKSDIDKETDQTNRGIYREYRKAQNPYGYNAEALAARGLNNSGYAETTQAKMYNTYQNNITSTMNNAKNLKSNLDLEISQAMQSGDLAKAQNAFDLYNQKMQLLAQEYQLRNNREQYLYQKEQDALAQSNWEKQYNYQQSRDQVADDRYAQEWAYQKERDAIADNRYLSEQERQARLDALDEQWRQKQFDYQQSRDSVADNRYNQEFAYQQNRDKISDDRYNQEWEYQKQRDTILDNRYLSEQERQRRLDDLEEQWRQKQWDYQVNRDAVSDSQWEREYELQKKTAEAARSRSYSSSGSKSSSKNLVEEAYITEGGNNGDGESSVSGGENASNNSNERLYKYIEGLIPTAQKNPILFNDTLNRLVSAGEITAAERKEIIRIAQGG